MSLKQRNNFIARRSFDDFDEYAQVLTNGRWDMDLEQLDRGQFTGDLVTLSVGPFVINHIKVNSRFLIRGQTPQETSIFGLPVVMNSSGSWMRKSLGLDTVQCLAPGQEYEAVSPAGFEAINCSVSRNSFETASDYEDCDSAVLDLDSNVSLACGRQTRGRMVSGLSRLLNQIQQNPDFLEQQSCISDCSEGISELLGQLETVKDNPARTGRRRARNSVVARAVEYLDSVQGNPVSVQQLRHQVNSSRSTLERAFAEHFGIKPKAYLMARRLNGVRKMLKTADPRESKISDVASRWGFWHMSQFAADYRRQFGELPSETLTRP